MKLVVNSNNLVDERFGSGTAGSILASKLVEAFQKFTQTRGPCFQREQALPGLCLSQNQYLQVLRSRWQPKCFLPSCYTSNPHILILEAGPQMSWFQRKLSDIPLASSLLFGVGIDRIHKTVPQTTSAAGLKNKQLLLPTGRMLGGTAMLNAMIFSFGNHEDESSKRFHSWDPHFFSELFKINEPVAGCQLRPEPVRRHPITQKLHSALSNIFEALGLPVIDKSDGWTSEGLHTPLIPTESRSIFQVLIDPRSEGTILGVKADSRGVSLKILLKTPRIPMNDATISPEVILSAGTFETPAILLRSGIGTSGVSVLAQTSALTSIAYLRTSLQRLHNFSRPDIQFTFIAAAVFEQEIFRTLGHFSDSVWRHFLPPAGQGLKNTIIILVSLLEPASRGHVQLDPLSLQSSETAQPEVDPAFFSVASDMERMVEAVSWLYSILTGHKAFVSSVDQPSLLPPIQMTSRGLEAFRALGARLHIPTYPGCPAPPSNQETSNDQHSGVSKRWRQFFGCLIQSITISNYHFVGTCPVTAGQEKNIRSVVSPNLK
ncbi:hypothetical protein P879_05222 [Paragonimus westermani]|uniref:Glucose-methanol-choline oxidoreductase N-terminal domain-containing protein n=1 Tax=Paragonimus westermani TaxID=34504 RepID=A0A8T0D0J6_9TREM|nr:hypothetical protein P879_05222 [Paragonimus westermani]